MRGWATGMLLVVAVGACGSDQPTFDRRVYVGESLSSPGWNMADPAGHRTGFDYDLAAWLGQQLKFEPIPVTSITKDRESDLEHGSVSLVVATYSISDDRKKRVGFAGPYMLSQQGIMVLPSEVSRYHSPADLGGKTVCATRGSTSIEALQHQLGVPVTPREEDVYMDCLEDLHKHTVDAISTDQLILYGLQRYDDQVNHRQVTVVADVVFGHEEQYGVGIPKGNRAKCQAITDKLKDFLTNNTWEAFFTKYFPDVPMASHKPELSHSHMEEC